MASTLNLKGFMKDFKNLKHISDDYMLPEGIEREKFELFLRMMQAKTLEEIADIPTETVLEMFEYVHGFSACIAKSCPLHGDMMLKKLKKVPSMVHKRPL